MKTILCIKKVVWMLCALFVVSACSYDDEEIWNKVNDHEERISALEDWQKQVNSNITALQELLNTQDYITKVSPLMENGVEIGYTIEFAKSDPITLYHGKKGESGDAGNTPVISLKKEKDGNWYWTLNGELMKDEEGNPIRANGLDGQDGEDGKDGADGEDGKDGQNGRPGSTGPAGRPAPTPQVSLGSKLSSDANIANEDAIEASAVYLSVDGGSTWYRISGEKGDTGSSGSAGEDNQGITVSQEDEYVTFTLENGSSFNVPYYKTSNELTITFDNTEIELEAGETTELTYILSYTENVKVSAIGEGVRTEISNGKLIITATSENFESGKVLVHATDGEKVAMVELTITKMVITYIEYTATQKLEPGSELKDIYLPEKSTYNEETGEGRIAIKGTLDNYDGYWYAFDTNTNQYLKSIKIPEGVETITQDAFINCSNLETVSLPSTLKEIGKFAFSKTSLKGEIVIPEGVTEIGESAFSVGTSAEGLKITKVQLPESLETIGARAFMGCSELTEITIPDKVTTIEEATFSQCSKLKTVVIGDGVTSIGDRAFQDCSSIETITLGKSVSSIGNKAFNVSSSWDETGYKQLKSITCNSSTPATLGTTPFPVSGTWNTYNYKIYVPSNAVQAYKSAWSDYSGKIQAITE